MRILCIGDIIAKTGRRSLQAALPGMRARLGVDLCIGNVENAAGIFGVTQKTLDEIRASGVDVMTSGNHIWDKREGVAQLDMRDDLLRPANYPPGVAGRGTLVRRIGNVDVAVVNLQGRTFMSAIDCPFRGADAILAALPASVKIIVIDFHAEATSEKQALASYVDGRASAVFGTHTHVQTSDERILPRGTACITDVGMAGPVESIIGVRREQVIERFLRGTPVRFEVAGGPSRIGALLVDVNESTGTARSIERISEPVSLSEEGGA